MADPGTDRFSLTVEEFMQHARSAVQGMCGIVSELGDTRANSRPGIPGANTPYALLVHCLGVMEYWAGHLVSGRGSDRDRAAEFRASGPVAPLVRRAEQALVRLEHDVRRADPSAPLRNALDPARTTNPRSDWTQGSALMHVFEELAQHRGQMEVIRDALRSEARITPR